MVIFSGSLPATRIGVLAFDPFFLSAARACIAALLGGCLLYALKQPAPKRRDWPDLLWVAAGCVVGFPLLSALALRYISSAHSIVYLGLLPLCTAIFAVWFGQERPRAPFWLFACAGSLSIACYALTGSPSSGSTDWRGDALMVCSVVVCGLGYARGASLSRRLGGWQVMSWALLVSLPAALPFALYAAPSDFHAIRLPAWAALAYVALFSMFIGFVFWYRGLAQGGIAAVGQLQLLQPFLGFALAHILLNEPVSAAMIATTLAAMICVFFAKKYA